MAELNTTIAGEVKRCNISFVTFYWTLPATGVHLYTNIALIAICLLVSLFGIIANVFVVICYVKNPRVRTLSNIPLLSVAFSDLLVSAVVLPLLVAKFIKEIYGTRNCILWASKGLATYFLFGVSLLSVTVISAERFITLAYPYQYQAILTKIRMNVVVAAVWIATFVVVISNIGLISFKVLQAIATLTIGLCIFFILVSWIWVYKLLKTHVRKINTNHRPSVVSKPETSQRQSYRNTGASGVIVFGLIISYIPSVVMLVYFWTEPESFTGIYLVSPWGETFLLSHSLFNPLYVFWRKSAFRETAASFIRRFTCHARQIDGRISIDLSKNSMQTQSLAAVI
ncbi:beta-1 adrenergic receptor-like [Dendronephthya gigantea]|uniref:beta-1 adrenergic receptor-like n=1 Tax=Dendronephthya gigantea TaxID=151771 RepID=UPI00106BF7BC|nr:beta-1 adrenergic receptor-like [Dendronephthya gigantea]